MIEQILNPQFVEALGWTLLHSLWQGAIFAILLALLFIALRSYTAQSRYVVATGLLTAFFLTVTATFWMQWQDANSSSTFITSHSINQQVADNFALNNVTATTLQSDIKPVSALSKNKEILTLGSSSHWIKAFSDYYEQHLPLLVTLWLLGVLFLQLRFLGQLATVQRLKHYGTQLFPEAWSDKIEELEGKLRIQKKVSYLTSVRIESPMVIGWLKPVVLMPQHLFKSLSETEIYAVLAHELAHIRREDFVVNLMQTLLCNVFFFHPGVWWMSNRVDEEREHCCDDLAVAATGPASSYAKTLINVAELQLNMQGNTPLSMALSGKAKKRERGGFAARIHRLFSTSNGAGTFREGFATACILFSALFLGMVTTGHTVQASEQAPVSEIKEITVASEREVDNTKESTKTIEITRTTTETLEGNRISNRTEPPVISNRISYIIQPPVVAPPASIAPLAPPAPPAPISPITPPMTSVIQEETRIDSLVMACAEGDLYFVQILINTGINVNGIGSEGFTPLMMAASEDEAEIVDYLLKHGANVNQIVNGWTALIEAADEGSLESMEILLKAGADVNYYSTPGSPTAITMAASEGKLDCLKLLLKNGADINGIGKSMPPLHIAAAEGKSAIVDYLISQNVNLNSRDANGYTALMHGAAEGQKYSIVKLVEAGADVSIVDLEGATARDYAIEEEEYYTSDYLGAEKRPAIHQATLDGLIEKVQRMVEQGIDVNSRDDYGRTPLHIASAENHTIDMRVLIELGAAINAQDKQGRTPLMYAAAGAKGDAVALLVSEVANVNIQDVDGMRAYEWALSGGNADLAKFLGLITEGKTHADKKKTRSRTENKARQHVLESRFKENEARQKELENRAKENEKWKEELEKRSKKARQKELEKKEKKQKEIDKRIEKEVEKSVQQAIQKDIEKRETVHVAKEELHIRQFDLKKKTPELFEAVRNGSIEQCRLLLAKGAMVNAADDTGQTALMVAAMTNGIAIAKFLIDEGADVNKRSASGLTALHYTALENYAPMAQLLLKNNAKVDAPMRYSSTDGSTNNEPTVWEYIGATPLLIAIEANNYEVAAVLIEAGANPHQSLVKNEYGIKKGQETYLTLSEVIGIDEDFLKNTELKSSDATWTPYKQSLLLGKPKMLKLLSTKK